MPRGAGPFPAVVYNHGGLETKIGGAPGETCEALARDGYVGFSPIRRPTRALEGHIDDVLAAMDTVLRLEYVAPKRLGVIGFSRGALLSFMAAIRRTDIRALVLMAPAPGGRNDLEQAASRASEVSAPVLLAVARNDLYQANHVKLSLMVKDSLEAAGKNVKFILYPPFRGDGHQMFFEVGEYWTDVGKFLSEHLAKD